MRSFRDYVIANLDKLFQIAFCDSDFCKRCSNRKKCEELCDSPKGAASIPEAWCEQTVHEVLDRPVNSDPAFLGYINGILGEVDR